MGERNSSQSEGTWRPMRLVAVFLLLLLAGFHLTVPAVGQSIVLPGKPVQQILKEWADPVTVENWTQAIRAGRRALTENRLDEAATFFSQAIVACEKKASEDIHQCIPRLLLAEILLDRGKTEEATVQVDQLVKSLKKAARYQATAKTDTTETLVRELVANAYRYQVGGALYLRAARIYNRLGTPRRAEPLFGLAVPVFEQKTYNSVILFFGVQGVGIGVPTYPRRHLRIAEILEAQCRFLLVQGRDELALKSLQDAEKSRKAPPLDANGNPLKQTEMFLDQLVAEPLDKSLLKRFLGDCAFYRFDDARIADLLDRQAVLLRKVSRNDEATAFERFAESLRKKPLPR